MNGQIFAAGVTLVSWAAVIYKGPAALRQWNDPATRNFWFTLLGIALGLTVLQQPAYGAIDHLLGWPNIARLLGDGLALGASCAVQAFLWQLNYPAERARRPIQRCGAAFVASLAIMAAAFRQIPLAQEDVDLLIHHPAAPFVLVYRLAFLAYLAVALVNVARLAWRYAEGAARPSMRLGLRLVTVGALLGLAYVGHEALWVLAARLGAPLLSAAQTLPRLLMASGIGLMVLGSTLPSWGPRVGLDALWRWVAAYRSLIRLYPLWRDLCLALPTIALTPPPPPPADRLNPRDVRFRLCRRVVEIRDGLLVLRPALAADDATDHAQEAMAVLTTLWQREARREVPAAWGDPVGAEFAAEVAALERLARWYRRPASARVLRRWLADASTAGVAADPQEGR